MINKRIFPLLLIMLIVLSSCGAASEKASSAAASEAPAATSEAPSPPAATTVFTSPAAAAAAMTSSGAASTDYWGDWVKDVPSGNFEQAGSEIFTLEQNGYAIEFTLDKWAATRGSGEYVLHPASSEIPLPLLKPSDCVIPFVLTAKTATKDTSFTTDFHFYTQAILHDTQYNTYVSNYLYSNNGCSLSRFEEIVENFSSYLDSIEATPEMVKEFMPQYHRDMWQGGISGNYYETKLGDEQVFIGCYVINNYYSPEFPNGNLDLFPKDCAFLRVSMKTPAGARSEEVDILIQ